jgi:hypothetical protein
MKEESVVKNLCQKTKKLANILEQSVKKPMAGDNSLKKKANGEQCEGV